MTNGLRLRTSHYRGGFKVFFKKVFKKSSLHNFYSAVNQSSGLYGAQTSQKSNLRVDQSIIHNSTPSQISQIQILLFRFISSIEAIIAFTRDLIANSLFANFAIRDWNANSFQVRAYLPFCDRNIFPKSGINDKSFKTKNKPL
jgi:hypothetical protein